MTDLERLQKEYNDTHERLGYTSNPVAIKAINNCLDALVEKMNKLIEEQNHEENNHE